MPRGKTRHLSMLSGSFYNLQVGRGDAPVARELRALLGVQPHVLGLVEATGYDLPDVKGYRLVRDRSSLSRANVAAYVRDDLRAPAALVRWHDCAQTWPRTQHDGMHEARSALSMVVAGWHVVIGHMPPNVRGAGQARHEVQAKLLHLMSGPRPQLLLYDANPTKVGNTGLDSGALAEMLRGQVVGSRLDRAVIVRATSHGSSYPSIMAGVELRSDHGHAFRIAVETQAYTAP